MKEIRLYHYPNCSTCKKAIKFATKKDVPIKLINIVDNPPSIAELENMLSALQGEIKKLFNTSGQLYRELNIKEKLPSLNEKQSLELLHKHGKLIKRPFLIHRKQGVVGFNESEWSKFLGRT